MTGQNEHDDSPLIDCHAHVWGPGMSAWCGRWRRRAPWLNPGAVG